MVTLLGFRYVLICRHMIYTFSPFYIGTYLCSLFLVLLIYLNGLPYLLKNTSQEKLPPCGVETNLICNKPAV